jgi:transglutaminase-like putative cysteine protease
MKEEIMKTTVKSVLFPSLLSFVVLVSILNVYEALNIFTAAGVFVMNFALFAFYEKLRLVNRNWLSALSVIILFIIAIIIAVQLARAAGRENLVHLIDWFFKAGDYDLHFPLFTAALMSFFTPFMSSTVFYFSNVRYNPFYLMLTCMTTFAIYAKTLTDVPFIFPALIIAVFLFLAVERRWYRERAESALGYRRFLLTGLCFVAGSAYIAGLFPPAETTPYRRLFDEFLAQGRFSDPIGFANIIDANWSGGAGGSNMNRDQVLFTVDVGGGANPQYLRRQIFDEFTGERWQHTNDWSHRSHTSRMELLPSLANQNFDTAGNFATITVRTGTPISIIPTLPNTDGIAHIGSAPIVVSIRDEFFFLDEPMSRRGISYGVRFRDEPARVNFTYIDSFDYRKYVASALELPAYSGQERVRELAAKLTDGIDCLFEQGRTIERHFYNGEFVYDLNFTPSSKCVYTFLFETQRGTCSDFATAMTVLAREAGIPARYVEGYVLEERDEQGRFVVRAEHGHAFPELFIDGHWHIFEPTIPGAGERNSWSYSGVLIILGSIGGAAVFALLFLIYALPRIRERRFRNRARGAPPDARVRLIYERIYTAFMKEQNLKTRTLSSRDVDEFAQTKYGVGLRNLTENYDRAVYGKAEIADGDYYETYVAFYESVKLKSKRRRS